MGKQARQRQQRAKQGKSKPLLGELALLSRRRAPYDDLLAAIVGDTLQRFPLGADADAVPRPVVEIGAGAGQLRAWLPPAIAARAVHTDPSPDALTLLRRRAPNAAAAKVMTTAPVAVARAQALPFRDGACDGVVGLCVFDAIHAGGGEQAAVAEIARVLAPGGRFVHLLDMATLVEAPFINLVASGLVPIPNVFGDPSDHEWPLDVLLLRRDWLQGLLALTAHAGHPLPTEFGAFFQAFLPTPTPTPTSTSTSFDVGVATERFKSLASDGERRFALSGLIASACRLAVQQGYPTLQPLPFHSGRYLASLLETTFRDSGAFRVELSQILTRSAWRPAARAGGARYLSLALGHERRLAELPARLLDPSARAQATDGDALVEAGAYVFVATRL